MHPQSKTESKTLELIDGRTLAYEVGGDPDGVPVLFQHGTGDSRLCRYPDESVTAAAGVLLVTVDRPGVGGSSPKAHRGILDWVPDVEALADELGFETFVVAGHSGGGPHALAIAKVLGPRVTKVGLASPLAPFDEPGNRKLVTAKDLRMIFHLHHLKFLAAAGAKLEAKMYSKDLKKFVQHTADSYPADKDVFLDPVLEPMFEAEFAQALRNGGEGSLADFWAFEDWGFKVEDVPQPVELFRGDADTILDPASADHLAARLPQASVHTWPGGGHYSVFALDRWREFLGALV